MKIVRTQTKLLASDTDSRVIRFVLSSALEDRAGDTIAVDGWVLDNYMQNPIVLWGHEQRDLPIGKMVELTVAGAQLQGAVKFATAAEYEFADTVYKLTKGGYLNAGSVGFLPKRWEFNDRGGIDFKEQELLEFSIVTVPCNPVALVNAKAAGVNLSPLRQVLNDSPSERFTEIKAALEKAETPAPKAVFNTGRLAKSVELTASKLRLIRR